MDLQEEILSRVPAKSLARWKSTSKQWKGILKTGSFAKKHSANAPKESLFITLIDSRVYLLRTNFHRVPPSVQIYLKIPFTKSSSQLEVDIRDIFHCDGFLLYMHHQVQRTRGLESMFRGNQVD